jgi:hypothetical protein
VRFEERSEPELRRSLSDLSLAWWLGLHASAVISDIVDVDVAAPVDHRRDVTGGASSQ